MSQPHVNAIQCSSKAQFAVALPPSISAQYKRNAMAMHACFAIRQKMHNCMYSHFDGNDSKG